MVLIAPLIRPAEPADAPALSALINRIIARGGTTAHQQPFSPEDFTRHFIDGPDVILCLIAEQNGRAAGFQSLSRHPALSATEADIGTFTDPGLQGGGIGGALFAATCARARALGVTAITAVIRADNDGGLRYYRGRGFRAVGIFRAEPLACGKKVDRIAHRLVLAA